MATKIIEVTDDQNGTTLASFEANTDMHSVAMTFYGIWHTPELMERYVGIMNSLGQWLRDNGGTA